MIRKADPVEHGGRIMHAIRFEDVCKSYARQRALKGVSFAVEEGDHLGLVGVNGAGKTTLIKCLLDFCELTSGAIRLFDMPHTEGRARSRIAFLPEKFTPPHFLRGAEFLRMMAGLYGSASSESQMLDIPNALALDAAALDKPVRELSKGMAQKLGIAACLLSGKDLLVMDEPMSGLDPRARALVKRQLLERRDRGQTLFFSTHLLSDVEALCNRVAVLHDGELRFVGALDAFRHRYGASGIEEAFLRCVEA
jgi:ABC-2 type transport system ATP-binding protein